MGDTALIRGIAAAAKQVAPQVRIIGVQAERAPAYYLSWKQGRVVGTETCDTIADGLATRTPEAENVRDVRAHSRLLASWWPARRLSCHRFLCQQLVLVSTTGNTPARAPLARQ